MRRTCLNQVIRAVLLLTMISGILPAGTANAAMPNQYPSDSQQFEPAPLGQSPAGWSLTFSDEFNQNRLDLSKWRTDYWNGGNGELQQYIHDNSHNNYVLQNGSLSLVARKESFQGKSYTSGIITTQQRFSQKYGFFEMRAKLPAGKGLWPAFWLMPDPTGWPPEIDVMENLGDRSNIAYLTFHYAVQNGSSQTEFATSNLSDGYHVFGLLWTAKQMIWYIDGVAVKQFSDASKIPDVPMFLLANLAVGGNWPGSPDASTAFPAAFSIDYIRVWQASGNTPEKAPLPGQDLLALFSHSKTTGKASSGANTASTSSSNIIADSTFQASGSNPWYSPWVLRNDLNAQFHPDKVNSKNGKTSFMANIQVANPTQPWVVSMMRKNLSFTRGQNYTLTFWAKASSVDSIHAVIQQQDSPYKEYMNYQADLSTGWTLFSVTFSMPVTTSAAMLNFNLASHTGNVWLNQIVLCEGNTGCQPPS